MTEPKTKKCEVCGEKKPIQDFSKAYKNRCKACVAAEARMHRASQEAATERIRPRLKDGVHRVGSRVVVFKKARIRATGEIVEVTPQDEPMTYSGYPYKAADGEVEWTYEDKDGYTHEEYHTCPICNGSGNSSPAIEEPTGRMIPIQTTVIGIYENIFNAYQVLMLCDAMEMLGIDKCKYVASSNANGNSFILTDEITVVICPCIADTPSVWVNRKRK